jgi:hypothetical protein
VRERGGNVAITYTVNSGSNVLQRDEYSVKVTEYHYPYDDDRQIILDNLAIIVTRFGSE